MELLIEAFEGLCETGHNVTLILTGRGLAYRMEVIRSQIDASPYGDRIEYKGYLTDKQFFRVLNDCDILCMVRRGSRYANAGFPFKLGEYLATARPVVATNVGDVEEFLEDRQSALLVEPDSLDALVAALRFLIEHPLEAQQIGLRGREVARTVF